MTSHKQLQLLSLLFLSGACSGPAENEPQTTQELALPSAEGLVPESIERNTQCFPVDTNGQWATTISTTGCYTLEPVPTPISAATPYTVRAPFWSDGAQKLRYLLIPDESTIRYTDTGPLDLPNGSVILKEFIIGDSLVESRFLALVNNDWHAATYRWEADYEEATLVTTDETITASGQQWLLPSSESCTSCHTQAADFVLGVRADQLFVDHDMFGLGPVNQISALRELQLFEEPLDTVELQLIDELTEESSSLEHRARSYLDVNCASCHQPGGAGHSAIDLRIQTPLSETEACDVYPLGGGLGLGARARIIAPGAPENSTLLLHMKDRGLDAMPPLGSFLPDDEAINVIEEWITGLKSCD